MTNHSALWIVLFTAPGCVLASNRELYRLGNVQRVHSADHACAALLAGAAILITDATLFGYFTSAEREHIAALRKYRSAKVVLVWKEQASDMQLPGPQEVDAILPSELSSVALTGFLRKFLRPPSSSISAALGRSGLRRVLIVDDSELTNRIITMVLEEAGYTVRCITSPFEIRLAVKEMGPDVILVDYNMPALRGDRLIDINRRTGLGVPMILYSSAKEEILEEAVKRCGAAGYIRKEAAPMQLLAKLESLANPGKSESMKSPKNA